MNIIEEYLVKIGATVDREAFNGAAQAINQLAAMAEKLGRVLKYGALLAAIGKVTEAIIKNIKAVAEADMEYQKLAKTMWVTKETAKAFSVITKTMGAKPEDIAWIPELREQFFRLRAEMNALATPSDADGQLRWIREIGYDVQSLQLKLKMLREWVVYYLIKYLAPYIKEIQKFIQWLGDKLGKDMPGIARNLARVLSQVVSVGASALRLFKSVYEALTRFLGALPDRTKKMVAVFAMAGAAIMAGPFGMFMVALGGALLLLEDFYYYLDGKKSSKTLAPMWAWLTKSDNPLRKMLEGLEAGLTAILNLLSEFFEKVMTEERQKQLKETVQMFANGIADIAKGLSDIIEKIVKKNSSTIKNFWQDFSNGVSKAIEKVLFLSGAVGELMSAIGKALSGNYKEAGEHLSKAGRKIYRAFISSEDAVDRAEQMTANPTEDLLGNPNGCTNFVQKALGEENEFAKLLNGNLWVPDWVKIAKENNRFTKGIKGMQRGDIVVIDDGSGEGSHVVIADGEGGYYGNSSSRRYGGYATPGMPVYGSMSDWDGQILGHIKTGKQQNPGLGAWPDLLPDFLGGEPALTGTSYAEALAAGATFLPTGGNSTNSKVINIGGIVVNCGNSTNPREIAAAVGDEVVDRAKRMAAWNGGGVLV